MTNLNSFAAAVSHIADHRQHQRKQCTVDANPCFSSHMQCICGSRLLAKCHFGKPVQYNSTMKHAHALLVPLPAPASRFIRHVRSSSAAVAVDPPARPHRPFDMRDFFGCYLLTSLDPKNKGRTYIGCGAICVLPFNLYLLHCAMPRSLYSPECKLYLLMTGSLLILDGACGSTTERSQQVLTGQSGKHIMTCCGLWHGKVTGVQEVSPMTRSCFMQRQTLGYGPCGVWLPNQGWICTQAVYLAIHRQTMYHTNRTFVLAGASIAV